MWVREVNWKQRQRDKSVSPLVIKSLSRTPFSFILLDRVTPYPRAKLITLDLSV